MSRSGFALGLAWLLMAALATGATQSRPPTPEEVEAAYLYQFGRYVDWPSDPTGPNDDFLICVLGMDPFGTALDEVVAGKAISGRPISVRRIRETGESEGCRILFISPSEQNRVAGILKALEGTGIVTVGRGPEFTRLRGGMIAFTVVDRKVRFVVNLAAAEAAGVTLSSQLLRVAVRVER